MSNINVRESERNHELYLRARNAAREAKQTRILEWPWKLLISVSSGTLGLQRAAPCYCVLFS
jgi:hypothetical protein